MYMYLYLYKKKSTSKAPSSLPLSTRRRASFISDTESSILESFPKRTICLSGATLTYSSMKST